MTVPTRDATPAAVLRAEDLVVRRGDTGPAVATVPTLDVPPGGRVAVLGRSGAGKTTLLLGALGLLQDRGVAAAGLLEVLGAPWPAAGSRAWRDRLAGPVTVLLQDARMALDPFQRLADQLAPLAGGDRDALAAAAGRLGLEDAAELLRRHPHEVSGGQAQRLLLAVALARRPRLLVADEPTASLDPARVGDLVTALRTLAEEAGTALLVATHDVAFARAIGAEPHALVRGRLQPGWPPRPPWPVGPGPVAADAEVVLAAEDVAVRLGRRRVLEGVSLALRAGEVAALVGPSGIGKTTLARVLAGQLRPQRGRVRGARGRAVQMLFQDAAGSLTPGRSVAALVAETAVPGFDVAATAAALGLDDALLGRSVENLSGGERRRAALLRALSVQPRALLLDEPTASLDRDSAVDVVGHLLAVQRRTGVACLWITHDHELARSVAPRDRVLQLHGDRACTAETETAGSEPVET